MLLSARRNLLLLLLLATVAMQAFSYAVASVQQSQMLPQHHAMISAASHCDDSASSMGHGCADQTLAVQQDDCCNEMDNCVSAHCLSLTACPDSHKLVSVSPSRFLAIAPMQSPLNAYPQSLYRPPITA